MVLKISNEFTLYYAHLEKHMCKGLQESEKGLDQRPKGLAFR